jgi:hypothetical protein
MLTAYHTVFFVIRDTSGLGYGRGGNTGGKFADSRDLGRGSSERWRRDDDGKAPPAARPGMPAGRRSQKDSDHLPEWATDESAVTSGGEAGGSFDDSGKFRAEQNRLNGVR